MRYYVRGSRQIKPNNSKFCPSSKYLKYFLSAIYSIHVNLLTSTTSYFTPFELPRLSLFHVTCSSHSTYFQIFLSNMRVFPFPSISQNMFPDLITLPLSQIRHSIPFHYFNADAIVHCRCHCSLPARFAITSVRPR